MPLLKGLKPSKTHLRLILVGITCLLITFVIAYNFKKQHEFEQRVYFNSLVYQIETAIKERLNHYIDAHYAGVGLFLSSKSVERAEWANFVESLNLQRRYPGINGLGYATWVQEKDKETFLTKVRLDNAASYQIKPTGIRPDYFPIVFIEPTEINLTAIGFDMGSENNRRQAMERARDTGETTISKKIILVQDINSTPGFLSYVPFYKKGSENKTIAERQKNFLGFIYAPFIMKDFMEGLLKQNLANIDNKYLLEIYDGPELKPEDLMFKTQSDLNTPQDKLLSKVITIDNYGLEWFIKINSEDNFEPNNLERFSGEIAFFVGLLLTTILLFLIRSVSNTKDKAVELAKSMTKEIQEKNTKLEKINEELQSFAHIASHDLKEPLRTISNYSGLVKSKLEEGIEGDRGDINKFLEYIIGGCKKMQTLINDLLHYSKFEDSNKELEELDCNELVNECLELLDQQIKEKNAEIKILNKLPKLKGRRSELIRVFQNLISNSIKYCEKQPVIEISSKELKDKSAHQFTIQDNGIGIAKEYQERIFRIFQRLHKDEEYSGTGLGLAITKKIIEAHGGSIYIESEPGQGSSFIFTISSSF